METECGVNWFGLPAGTSPSGLLRALDRAGYRADLPAVSRHESLFVETQDGRLRRQSCRLSVRRAGRGTTWCFAGPEGLAEEPFEGSLDFRSLRADAPGIPSAAGGLAAGRLLFPLVRLRVCARETRIQSPSGGTLALSLERFSAAPPGADWPRGAWQHGLLTVRLLTGSPEILLHLATYLRDRLGLPVAAGDACRAALQALGLPEPGAPTPVHLQIRFEDTLVLAARKVVGQQLLRMEANVAGTLEDLDSEYLHDLRVAARRLRSALRLFADVLGLRLCHALRVELAWFGAVLGAVRDLDVFILNLQAQAQRLGESGAVAELLAVELRRQRGPARGSLEAALASRRFRLLMRRLGALASSPPPRRTRGPQALPVAAAAPALLRKAQGRVLRLGRTVGPASAAAELHRLRILFKRLRYACEFFREAFLDSLSGQDPLTDYLQAMVRFQDCLGRHQDAMIAAARIQDLARDMVQRQQLPPDRLLDLGGLIQVQREIARERRGRLAKLWARFDKRSVRKVPAALGGEAAARERPAAEANDQIRIPREAKNPS